MLIRKYIKFDVKKIFKNIVLNFLCLILCKVLFLFLYDLYIFEFI